MLRFQLQLTFLTTFVKLYNGKCARRGEGFDMSGGFLLSLHNGHCIVPYGPETVYNRGEYTVCCGLPTSKLSDINGRCNCDSSAFSSNVSMRLPVVSRSPVLNTGLSFYYVIRTAACCLRRIRTQFFLK